MGRVISTGVVGLLCLAVAGSAAAQTTEGEYLDRVDRLCKKNARTVKKKLKKQRPSGDPGFDAYRAGVLFNKQFAWVVRRIARVERPEAIREPATKFVKGLRREKRLTARALRALRNGKQRALVKLGKKVGKVRKANGRRATELGLRKCGKASPA